ncbi:acetate uptake transporter family protein [Streptomyces sp. R-74717]|uniref:GPR1/FUN34/YaaH family transporter n=1 Tax=Streptomyces sp. R-74717 TaxID=2969820 RepID=UPI0039B51FF4
MDNDVSAGSTSTSTLGHLALGLTLLAFGIGHTRVVDGVTAAGAVSLALYVGGIALFVAGLLAFRAGSGFTGTAFAGLGAFWFTWGSGADAHVSSHAAGLFLLLLALLLLGVGQFVDSGSLAKAGGWLAAVSGLAAWYGATAALANWPTALPGRAAGRRVTATG